MHMQFPKIFNLVLGLILIVFGIITAFFLAAHGEFSAIYSVKVMSVFFPVMALGLIAVGSGLLILFPATKIAGYFLGVVITGSLMITSIISLWTTPSPHSPTLLFFPVLVMAYLVGAFTAIRNKYNPEDLSHENNQGTS